MERRVLPLTYYCRASWLARNERLHRHLAWEGCFNARDLGGLRTTDGSETRRRRVIRADAFNGLTATGWAALLAYGVRTVIDLRNDDELGADAAPRPPWVTTLRLPLDASEDREFWSIWGSGPQFGSTFQRKSHSPAQRNRNERLLRSAVSKLSSG
ncbi:MAG TPA: tyrosine-protein phosphatase [Thermoleophilaceae bacterium]|nr:tyrosine-protein phosphatase [Thermoleophilaceae bacterium]